jgi:hypothetical protein
LGSNRVFVHRLRHNVIKTGVKIISLSYSKISLENIAQKLQLDSAVDAEFIVAKVNAFGQLTGFEPFETIQYV